MLGIKKHITNFRKYSYLLSVLVVHDIEKKYKGSILGILWSMLNPLLHMIVLTIVFSSLLQRQIANFPLYILTGRLVFGFISTCTSTAMKSIISASKLINKVYIPKYILVFSKVIAEFIFFLISMFNLVFVILWSGASFSWHLVFLPLYLVLLLLFVLGVSLILATVTTFFRDIEHIYGVFITMVMYLSAIFYPPEIVPARFQFLLTFNPVFHFIQGFRQLIYYQMLPGWNNFLACLLVSLVFLALGMIVFERYQDQFIFNL